MFKHPLEPLRKTILPSTSLPPYQINFVNELITVIQFLSLAYQTYHCSSILSFFVCISVFYTLLYALCYSFVMHCVSSHLDPPFLYSLFQLLHAPPSTLLNPSPKQQPIFSLFCVLIVYVCLLHDLSRCFCMLSPCQVGVDPKTLRLESAQDLSTSSLRV